MEGARLRERLLDRWNRRPARRDERDRQVIESGEKLLEAQERSRGDLELDVHVRREMVRPTVPRRPPDRRGP